LCAVMFKFSCMLDCVPFSDAASPKHAPLARR